ncbi:unnamed protein product [Microthlaspi erraticum]|uniref:Malectin-like domain-containing protein n=1 Tax=Microthlaspi erraticum TaxID=1685480 RepID=A0A6D2IK97_9BRAS|nr:unnamed protein product [Microthlaspi erraticum]
MAISHVQPLLLLLASLFFLPTLFAHKFEYCNNNTGYDFGHVSGVATTSRDNDTTTTIYISVHPKKTLYKGSASVYLFYGENPEPMDGCVYELSEVVNTLPIKPDTNIRLTLTEVPLQNDLVVATNMLFTVASSFGMFLSIELKNLESLILGRNHMTKFCPSSLNVSSFAFLPMIISIRITPNV